MSEGYKKTFEHVGHALGAVETFRQAVVWSEHKFHWDKLKVYAEALFARGPFKVGDRVRLTKTPRIDEKHAWGWLGSKHFLVEGALATVQYVDFYDGHFCAGLYFDDESWISETTREKHPAVEKALYQLWETQIERVVDERGETR